MKAAQHHSLLAASLAITRALLLLAVMLLWPENRVWAFELAPQIASAETSHATPSSIRENLPLAVDPASGCCVAAEEAPLIAKSAYQLGIEGETAVRNAFDIGDKVAIDFGGRTIIPDGFIPGQSLSEVKNVGSLSFTNQLRTYSDFAQANGLDFNLYTRPGTTFSGPLQNAIDSGLINRFDIPQ